MTTAENVGAKLDEIKADKAAYASFMRDEITHVCRDFPKRDPGGEGERIACEYMAQEMSELAEDVKIEPFKVYPASFMGWVYVTVTCVLLAFASYFFATMISLVLIIIGLIPMLTQFVFYKRFTDPLYPEKTSYNVTAVKKCSGEVKRRVFYNGHPDAAWEWSTNYRLGGAAFIAQFIIAVIGILYLFALDIARWIAVGEVGAGIAGGAYLYAGLAGLVFVPIWILCYFLSNTKVVVDGANDNLTGCYMGISVLKALKDKGVELEHTEVGVIITGSKEAGLRGAKAWCEAHKDDYKDVETKIVSYDTIRDAKFLQVNRRDLNGLVKSDREACDLFVKAAKNTGVHCLEGTVPFGATDCAAFNQGGFRSAGVTALNHNLQKYYHTRLDNYDNLDESCLADCFEVSVELLKLWDKSGNGSDAFEGYSVNVDLSKSDASDEVESERFEEKAEHIEVSAEAVKALSEMITTEIDEAETKD